jgi:hypothetical protein
VRRKSRRVVTVEIDKLTNSLEHRVTGEVFDTRVVQLFPSDVRQIKKRDWQFDWRSELNENTKEVYKLIAVRYPEAIQGLMSLSPNVDHVFVYLVESAHVNIGKKKKYVGVPGNLIAFACKKSFELGFDGFVSFIAKSALINHYRESLGAELVGRQKMVIDTRTAKNLMAKYF